MADVSSAGLFVYAKDTGRLTAFYEAVLGMVVVHKTVELTVLRSAELQLVIQAMPPAIAAGITIANPPVLREDAALKFFFTVPSLAAAEKTAQALGGAVLAEQWRGPGFVVRNAFDPEGNIFQLRERIG